MNGFSLFEILITLAIVTIFSMIAIPSYRSHIIHTQRMEAEITLSKLAVALEKYYLANNTYKDSSISIPTVKNYRIEISSADDTEFSLAAIPASADIECGTLMLNSKQQKGITGAAGIQECW